MKIQPSVALVMSLTLIAPAAAVVTGSNWPEWRGPGPNRRVHRDRPAELVVAHG